jgi:hypothetical protein
MNEKAEELFRAHDLTPDDIHRPKVLSERTGRLVYDSKYNHAKREEYYARKEREAEAYIKKLSDQHGLDSFNMMKQLSERDNNPMQVLGTIDVAQELKISQGMARERMRRGVIPSYQIKGRFYCHAYVLDDIKRRAPEILSSDEFVNLYADAVYKHDMGEPWRKRKQNEASFS